MMLLLFIATQFYGKVDPTFAEEQQVLLDEHLEIQLSDDQQTAEVITGTLSNEAVDTAEEAEAFLENKTYLINKGGNDVVKTSTKYTKDKLKVDEYGNTHYRTNLIVEGIPVYGAEMIVHTNSAGVVYAINGKTKSNIPQKQWNELFIILPQEAINLVLEDLSLSAETIKFVKEPTSDKFIYELDSEFYPVYVVDVAYFEPTIDEWRYFVNAETGEVVDFYSNKKDMKVPDIGTGVTVDGDRIDLNISKDTSRNEYYLIDQSRGNGTDIAVYDLNHDDNYYSPGSEVKNNNNNFNRESDRAAVSALINGGRVYDYYQRILRRDSVDDNGMDINLAVHYGTNVNNAFWVGDKMVFGDGSGGQWGWKPLSTSLDITAHEMTHGVTQYTSGLEYRNQSGAVNEALSDIMGIACEDYFEGASSDWLIGEDVYNQPGGYLRSLENPSIKNYPDHMDNYVNTTSDYGGVHTNSSIINKAAYNIGVQLGKETMGKLFYHANANYLTRTSDFMDMREAILLAASDQFGQESGEYAIAMNAFADVGIGEYAKKKEEKEEAPEEELSGWVYEDTTFDWTSSKNSDVKSVYKITNTGARAIGLYLSNIQLENGQDYIYIKDESGKYIETLTGNIESKIAVVNGETLIIELDIRQQNKDARFVIDRKAFYYDDKSMYQESEMTYGDYESKDREESEDKKDKGQKENGWIYEDVVIESSHPYKNNSGETYKIEHEGAEGIGVYFENISLENEKDYINIKNAQGEIVETFTGNIGSKIVSIRGDAMYIELSSDSITTDYGFKIWRQAYYLSDQNSKEMSPIAINNPLDLEIENEKAGWNYVDLDLERECAKSDIDNTQIIRREGASHLAVYFDDIQIENSNAHIIVYDKNMKEVIKITKNKLTEPIRIEGDTMTLKITKDDDSKEASYSTSKFAYYLREIDETAKQAKEEDVKVVTNELGWNYCDKTTESGKLDNYEFYTVKQGATNIALYFEYISLKDGEVMTIYDGLGNIEEITTNKEKFIVQLKGDSATIKIENIKDDVESRYKIIKEAYYFE